MSPREGSLQRIERRVVNAHQRADWSPVEQLYPQIYEAIATYGMSDNAGPGLPEVLVGSLAVRIGRVCANYSGDENSFVQDAEAVLGQFLPDDKKDHLFENLYNDQRIRALPEYGELPGRRRRPTPFEAAVETARRLRDLATIRRAFQRSRTPTASVLGGSLSYGRFFNVRGPSANSESSDVDVLLVVPEINDISRIPGILKPTKLIRQRDLDAFASRLDAFAKFRRTVGERTLFSHKVTAWDESKADRLFPSARFNAEYGISFHVTDREGFEAIVLHKFPRLDSDQKAVIWDFRTSVPAPGIARGFDGIEERFEHTMSDFESNKVARFRIFDTFDQRFKPGLHQQLVLPGFEFRWTSSELDISLPLVAFRWKLLERLRLERQWRPYRVQNVSLTHVRYHTFAPHVRRRTDAMELEY